MEKTYQAGNTVQLSGGFFKPDGNYIDPDVVTLRIYDSNEKLIESYTLDMSNRVSMGQYVYDYVTPNISGNSSETRLYYEFGGTIQGYPSLKRDSIRLVFNT